MTNDRLAKQKTATSLFHKGTTTKRNSMTPHTSTTLRIQSQVLSSTVNSMSRSLLGPNSKISESFNVMVVLKYILLVGLISVMSNSVECVKERDSVALYSDPTFSIPSSIDIYGNTPVNIPIVLLDAGDSVKSLEYSWTVKCCTSNALTTIASSIDNLPMVSVDGFDEDIIEQFSQFNRTRVDGRIRTQTVMLPADVYIKGKGTLGSVVYQTSQRININLTLLGVYVGIVGENQNIALTSNQTKLIVMPHIQIYDTRVKPMNKTNSNCRWNCQFMMKNDTKYYPCGGFDELTVFSSNNCNEIDLFRKADDIYNVDHFVVSIDYKYRDLYYYESDNYTISLRSIAFNGSIPNINSIGSNIEMLNYQPANSSVTLVPIYEDIIFNNTQKKLVIIWSNPTTGEEYSFGVKKELTLSNLVPNSKYTIMCTISYLGSFDFSTSMQITFRTSHKIANTSISLVPSGTRAFTDMVYFSGYLGSSGNRSVSLVEITAYSTTGNISLTNGRAIHLNSYFGGTLFAFRLPFGYNSRIKVTVIISDGISKFVHSQILLSDFETILENYSATKISQLVINTLGLSGSTPELDRTHEISDLVVATSILNDFKVTYEATDVLSASERSTLMSTYASIIKKLNSYSNFLQFEGTINNLAMVAQVLNISKWYSYRDVITSDQAATTGSLAFSGLKYLLSYFESVPNSYRLDTMNTLFSKVVGENGTSRLFEALQMAVELSSSVSFTETSGSVTYLTGRTLTDLSLSFLEYLLHSTTTTSFNTTLMYVNKLSLTDLKKEQTFRLNTGAGIEVGLPAIQDIIGQLSSGTSFYVILQVVFQNNLTDTLPILNSNNTDSINSYKLEFQVYDPVVGAKLDLKNLVNPIRLKLPSQLSEYDMSLANTTQGNSSINPRCVYWDDSTSLWSTNGCTLSQISLKDFTCLCNHTTTFSVLTTTLVVNSNATTNTTYVFSMTPLIVITSVTGSVILITLGLATIIEGILHVFANAETLVDEENETTPRKEVEDPNRKRYRDLRIYEKLWQCLKLHHPFFGLVFSMPYFRNYRMKRIDRLIIIMVMFVSTSTANVVLLSTNTVTTQWFFLVIAAISLGFSLIAQLPVVGFLSQKKSELRVFGYASSALFSFVCLIMSVVCSAGVFTQQMWHMDILIWVYTTIISLVWDLIILKPLYVILSFLLLELRIYIFKLQAKYYPETALPPEKEPVETITVENSVRIPILNLSGRRKAVAIPKLSFSKVEGITAPSGGENIDELSSMHGSSDETSTESYSTDDTSSQNDTPPNETANGQLTKTSSDEMIPVDMANLTETYDPEYDPEIDTQVKKEQKKMKLVAFASHVRVKSETTSPTIPPISLVDETRKPNVETQSPQDDHLSHSDFISELTSDLNTPKFEDNHEDVEDTEKQHDAKQIESEGEESDSDNDSYVMIPIDVGAITPEIIDEDQVDTSVENVLQEQPIVEENKLEETVHEDTTEPEVKHEVETMIQEAETPASPATHRAVIETIVSTHVKIVIDREPYVSRDIRTSDINIVFRETLDIKIPPSLFTQPVTVVLQKKSKASKDINDYVSEVENFQLSSVRLESIPIFSEIPMEKLTGKSIKEILVIMSEYTDMITTPSTPTPQMSSPFSFGKYAHQRSSSMRKSSTVFLSGGLDLDSSPNEVMRRNRSPSMHKQLEIEDFMIRPHRDFFEQMRYFIIDTVHDETLVSKWKNEILFLQTIYLHYKLISVSNDIRHKMAKQITALFLIDHCKYPVNIGFFKRVIFMQLDNVTANSFERACEIVEISLKPLLSEYLKKLYTRTSDDEFLTKK